MTKKRKIKEKFLVNFSHLAFNVSWPSRRWTCVMKIFMLIQQGSDCVCQSGSAYRNYVQHLFNQRADGSLISHLSVYRLTIADEKHVWKMRDEQACSDHTHTRQTTRTCDPLAAFFFSSPRSFSLTLADEKDIFFHFKSKSRAKKFACFSENSEKSGKIVQFVSKTPRKCSRSRRLSKVTDFKWKFIEFHAKIPFSKSKVNHPHWEKRKISFSPQKKKSHSARESDLASGEEARKKSFFIVKCSEENRNKKEWRKVLCEKQQDYNKRKKEFHIERKIVWSSEQQLVWAQSVVILVQGEDFLHWKKNYTSEFNDPLKRQQRDRTCWIKQYHISLNREVSRRKNYEIVKHISHFFHHPLNPRPSLENL